MRGWGALVLLSLVAAIGTAGTFIVGAATGMGAEELTHLAAFVLPALVVTVVAMWVAGRLLAGATIAVRLVSIGAIGATMALANVWVLSRQMFVSSHDATLVAVILCYSAGVGMATAVAVARSSSTAIERLTASAEAHAAGDLTRRTGPLGAGPELDLLARTLDDMATRLDTAQRRERAAEATRRDLVTAVSHDLRTPLASLRAMVEAIDDGVIEDRATLRRYATEMRVAIERLVAMVDDLFELAQLDAAAIETTLAKARLADVVGSAVSAVELDADRKGVHLVAELGSARDAPCPPRLARVLQDLLVNAVRHTPSDGAVRVAAQTTPGALEISVEDDGEGMAPADAARAFEPFFRADPARHGPGAGLGLALAKRIVESLGGEISVVSTPGAGSRFSFTLPIDP
jgi:signal transduction histidine kinase